MFLDYYPLSFIQTLLSAACFYAAYYVYWYSTTGATQRRLAALHDCKTPRKWRTTSLLLGLDFFYDNYKALKAHRALEDFATRFWALGVNTVQISLLGKTFVSTIEPENLKSVLATDFKSWRLGEEREKVMAPFLGEGIFTSDGAAWQHSREMLRPNFVRSQVGDCEMFERHVQQLIKAIPGDGGMVDLQPLFLSLSLDVATEFLFGQSTNTLSPDGGTAETKEFARAFDHVMNAWGGQDQGWEMFVGLMVGLFLPNWKLKGEYRIVHDYVDGLVERAVVKKGRYEYEKENSEKRFAFPGGRYIFLFELLDQTTDKVKIRSELLNILLAGRDTTAALLSNVWFELSKRPAVWDKLQREVSSLNGEFPTFEQLKEMKFLRAILNESLRLYPIVPENSRMAVVDTVLPVGGGEDGKSPIFVKNGQMAHWSVYVMHRRKDIYGEDAEEYRPERWLDGEEGKGLRVGWEYLPFNGGPRICIGQQFALTEASYITVRLMQEFSAIESKDPEPWREKFTIVCTGLGGCKVVLTPRT
ncbi:hypothetical protein OEA41_009958 [Lepraria neglecta]|uniref:Cytochrome P450 n=1 Tax=Lepraria neglecta TaxID=209136 RepID=A0AAD9YY45_9LECA|nr:hypothetical protein OEA41_009958 [Lepraria neglecta]